MPSSSGSSASALPAHSASMDLKGVTLTVWESNSVTAGYKALFTAFEKATGAKIDQVVFPDPFESNLLTKWATGTRPDLMVFQSATDYLQQLNPAKNLIDLTGQPYVAKELFHQNKYASVSGGKDYGLSLETPSVFGLWFNKQIVAKDGLSAPTDFNQLVSACQTIKKDNPGVSPLYDAGGDQWTTQVLPFMLWTDAMKAGLQNELNTNKAKWTNQAIVQSLADYQTLIKDGCFNSNLKTGTYAQQESEFESGKVAMIPQGSWVSPDLVKAMGVTKMNQEIGWQAMSTSTATAAYSTTFSLQVPKTADTKGESAALSFLDFASGPAYQTFVDTNDQAPALSGFKTPANVPDALLANYTALAGSGYPQLFVASYGPFTTYMSEMIDGSATPERVANDLQQQWEQSATALSLPGF
ncbi:ABC transporter substrate-binding protein [Streptacidiphilus sp. PB12-B1b]|uniref:ABC transporter substrate-binding protein n=1 Tax=Streptacidiphilus sp. PB12-B1b TaxID=2705012 RepID=UPI000A42EA1A|nr:extracellular solute-binding protein [Streptacidiphilus sp. PB12-B1b]